MSTEFVLHKDGDKEVAIVERSARFDLDLTEYYGEGFVEGPQKMSAQEAMEMAAGILYAVSCSYPEEAEQFIETIDNYGIDVIWTEIAKARQT